MNLCKSLFLGSLLGAVILRADLPAWVSADGQHSFEGRYLDLEGDTVRLANADGAEVRVPLIRLDQDSRNRALTRSLHADSPGRRVLFSHFTEHYRLTLHNHHDFAQIQFRERGVPVDYPPMILRLQHTDRSDGRRGDRDFRAMDVPVELQGEDLVWRARMQSEAIVETRIRMLPDGMDFGYRIEFPEARPDDPRLAVVAVLPPVLEHDMSIQRLRGPLAPQGVEQARVDQLMRPFSVRFRTQNNRSGSLSYTELRQESVSELSRIELRGPYTRGLITFLAPEGRNQGELSVWYYEGGRSLLSGGRFRHTYPELPETDEVPAWFRLRFE